MLIAFLLAPIDLQCKLILSGVELWRCESISLLGAYFLQSYYSGYVFFRVRLFGSSQIQPPFMILEGEESCL